MNENPLKKLLTKLYPSSATDEENWENPFQSPTPID